MLCFTFSKLYNLVSSIYSMSYRLICFDMDGVIFKDINFWMKVHEVFDTLEEGKILTKKYLHTNYNKLIEEVVVKLWKGKDATNYFKLINSLEYLPGVNKVFNYIKKNYFITAIISASSIDVARRVQKDFGIDHIFANELVIKNNKISGEFLWPIGAGNNKKADIIKNLCKDLNISKKEVIYIGDSAEDIEAFKEVGLSIAFNSDCEELKEIATYIVEGNDLSKIIKLLPK